uniref:B box-type domain-containing protein n=1 Tax=Gopherus evgoodei TaxID=1825980 RepID=A0A8C4WBZ8_9SAUR
MQITCPWCKEDFQEGKSGSDNQPWKAEEIDKQLLLEELSLWPERVCENHSEELKLYCVEDQTFICVVCRDIRAPLCQTLHTHTARDSPCPAEIRILLCQVLHRHTARDSPCPAEIRAPLCQALHRHTARDSLCPS